MWQWVVTSHEHCSPSPNTGAQSSWDISRSITNLISDVIPSSHAMQCFTQGFASYLATRIISSHDSYISNCYRIMNLFLRKSTFTENQTFLQKFSTMKIWSHTVVNLLPGYPDRTTSQISYRQWHHQFLVLTSYTFRILDVLWGA